MQFRQLNLIYLDKTKVTWLKKAIKAQGITIELVKLIYLRFLYNHLSQWLQQLHLILQDYQLANYVK